MLHDLDLFFCKQLQIYLSEVLDWYRELSSQQQWDETAYSPTRKKLLAALENISGYNPEGLLKRLPADALYEERAILLGKLNQHELALSLYVHKVIPGSFLSSEVAWGRDVDGASYLRPRHMSSLFWILSNFFSSL